MVTIMDKESHFHDTVNLIYEAVLDEKLWPKALTSLADVMETTHIGLCAMDRRAQSYDSIVPRTDPEWDARYKQFWAFHNPLWTLSTKWPANEIFFPDDLMPREDFVAMPIYTAPSEGRRSWRTKRISSRKSTTPLSTLPAGTKSSNVSSQKQNH